MAGYPGLIIPSPVMISYDRENSPEQVPKMISIYYIPNLQRIIKTLLFPIALIIIIIIHRIYRQ